jgi:integrase
VVVSRGTVYLRGKTWTIGYTVDGRRVREAIGASRKLAEMVLKKRVTEAIEGRWFEKRIVGNIPFSELAETYLERATIHLKSAKSERDRVKFWVREFGNRPIGQITRGEIEDWQRRRAQTNKPATVNRMLCRLRHLFNKAVEWELLDESPVRRLKFLRENNARLRYLSLDECRKLIDACIASHMKATVTVALHTGMRQGEILNLKWDDLDLGTRSILIRDSKNGERRHVPMDSTLATLFASYPHTPGSDYVFPNAQGGRMKWVQKAFRNALARAGITDFHFHDLRHTFASQWMMNGGDLYVLKEILGHKTVQMTQRYAHLSPAYKRAMVDRMEKIWWRPVTSSQEPSQAPKAIPPVTDSSQATVVRVV